MTDSTLGMNLTVDVAEVRATVIETLGIDDRADAIDASTPLTSMPELDSMAVLELVVELERRFGITVEDEDVTAEAFETVASLAAFVASRSSG
jgi:acyl carrier protein